MTYSSMHGWQYADHTVLYMLAALVANQLL